jgi:hypothetical protein
MFYHSIGKSSRPNAFQKSEYSMAFTVHITIANQSPIEIPLNVWPHFSCALGWRRLVLGPQF